MTSSAAGLRRCRLAGSGPRDHQTARAAGADAQEAVGHADRPSGGGVQGRAPRRGPLRRAPAVTGCLRATTEQRAAQREEALFEGRALQRGARRRGDRTRGDVAREEFVRVVRPGAAKLPASRHAARRGPRGGGGRGRGREGGRHHARGRGGDPSRCKRAPPRGRRVGRSATEPTATPPGAPGARTNRPGQRGGNAARVHGGGGRGRGVAEEKKGNSAGGVGAGERRRAAAPARGGGGGEGGGAFFFAEMWERFSYYGMRALPRLLHDEGLPRLL